MKTQRLFFIAASFFVSTHVFAQTAPKDLDNYVESVRKEFEVPGISVAIVKAGKVVAAKGYGVRKLGELARVDDRTLFGIASNTKAFTATALGLLVEEGKLEWDAPVVRYLPWFQLSDPYVTRELSVRDLLVHRSGLPLGAGDLLWWPASTYDRKEIAKRLRFLPLNRSFRSAYAYDNVLYLIAGEVIEQVTGKTWEDFVAFRILAKVGMNESNVRHSDAANGGNVAATHARIEGKVRPVASFSSDNTNPAGGINSNARDMAEWMICQLDSGRVADGTRLFSPRTTRELWSIVTPIPIGSPPPELATLRPNFNGYALGFGVRDYRGYKVVSHTGGLPGYVSKLAMIPELRLGVTVLTNQESGAAFESIVYFVLDHYIGTSKTNWLSAFKKVVARSDSMTAAMENQTASVRDMNSRPLLPLPSYAGTYVDQWYGNVTITHNNGKLAIRFAHTPSLVGDLDHWQYDTFVARWKDRELRADAFVTFSLNPDGSIDQVKMKAVSPATDFSFDFHDLLLKPAKKSER
ncbi:MAG: serine hydrolase [Ignavibacteriales bacterium]|nr:serine hydrolase [Ignavibacteriales bacterium]